MNRYTNISIYSLSVLLLLFSFTGNHGYINFKKLNSEIEKFTNTNSELENKILLLKNKINSLKNNNFALERTAREELGLAKSDEIIYIFSEPEKKDNSYNDTKKDKL